MSSARFAAAVIGVALAAAAAARPAPAPRPADLIVRGGPVYTADGSRPRVEAFAVSAGRFVAAGSAAAIAAWQGPDTRVIELGGRTVVPGLQDAHGHVLGLGEVLTTLDLRGTTSRAQVVAQVRARAASQPAGSWILGRNWDQNDWQPAVWPSRADLDAAVRDHPVWLSRVDGHAGWANSRALGAAHITSATPDPPGGRLLRDASGAPTGVLIDTAQALVERTIPPASEATVDAQILAADRALRKAGVTMVHDAGASSATIAAYSRLIAGGQLATRLYVMIDGSSPGTTGEWLARGPEIDPAHRLTVRAIKLYADGALGSRGAALLEEYADEPGTRGLLVTPPEELTRIARAAARAGFQPCTHAIGDRANRIVLDAYEAIEREQPKARALRPRIEHAQILDAADISRFGSLGVIASMQPTHCTSDMPWAPARLGPARIAEGAYVWQALLKSGARLASGSDFPVEEPSPLLGFHAAVTRQDPAGQPPGGWSPEQRLSREEALRSFTIDAAFAAHAEDDLGSITVGKLADFVVLSRDIMTCAPDAITGARVERTVIAGRDTFSAMP